MTIAKLSTDVKKPGKKIQARKRPEPLKVAMVNPVLMEEGGEHDVVKGIEMAVLIPRDIMKNVPVEPPTLVPVVPQPGRRARGIPEPPQLAPVVPLPPKLAPVVPLPPKLAPVVQEPSFSFLKV